MFHIPQGVLVAVEGIDGAGKTSLATILAQYCGERGIACTLSKEPTGLKWGTELRRSASEGRLTLDRETELFELDRRDHVERSIKPALMEGNVVILDRYYWSSAAYQGSRGGDYKTILERNEDFAPVPDLVFLLDIEAGVGIERIRKRGDNPNLFEDNLSLSVARKIFSEIASGSSNVIVINADQPLRGILKYAILKFTELLVEKISRAESMDPQRASEVLELLRGEPLPS